MGPHFKPEVSHQGPSWTPGTYACCWAKNDWTMPCQRQPGVQAWLPCYSQYEVRPRASHVVDMLFFQLHRFGAKSMRRFGIAEAWQSFSTLQTAWCAVLCPTLLCRSWCTGILPTVGNACWASLARVGAWGCGMPVAQPQWQSTAASARASSSQGTSV